MVQLDLLLYRPLILHEVCRSIGTVVWMFHGPHEVGQRTESAQVANSFTQDLI